MKDVSVGGGCVRASVRASVCVCVVVGGCVLVCVGFCVVGGVGVWGGAVICDIISALIRCRSEASCTSAGNQRRRGRRVPVADL